MILQALTSLYETLAQKGEISKEGWSREKISFALSIDEEGNLLRVTPLLTRSMDQRAKRGKFRRR